MLHVPQSIHVEEFLSLDMMPFDELQKLELAPGLGLVPDAKNHSYSEVVKGTRQTGTQECY